jgi:hypothetical protein
MTPEENRSSNQVNQAKFLRNVILKGLLLFLLLNLLCGLFQPGIKPSHLSLYNILFPGRMRLPFGENPKQAYNLSLYDLDVMLASHEISRGPKPQDEYRVILIGDSAAWGTLLKPQETLSGLINSQDLITPDEKHVQAYNLAYPTLSLTKDLMILEAALRFEPDLVL